MLHREPEFLLDRAQRNAKTIGDLALGHAIESGRDQNLPTAGREFGDALHELAQIGARLDDVRRVRRFIRDVDQGVDFSRGQIPAISDAAIACRVERDPEKITWRTPDGSERLGARQQQPCILDGVASKVRRSKPPGQPGLDFRVSSNQELSKCARGNFAHIST